jgi:methylphosphotriester-DNA--protein-cysteine methyltransferase
MTTREFYQTVINCTNGEEVDYEAMRSKAQELIAALDAKNEKRKNTETKEQKEAAARAAAVLAFLKEQTEPVTRDTIAGVLGMSPAQASAACKALGGAITKTEIKVDKARKVAYSIA